MSLSLKACPFCGGDAKLSDDVDANYSIVKCTNCGAETGIVRISKEYCANDKAVTAWNNRVNETTSEKTTATQSSTEKLGHWIKEHLGNGMYRYRCSECNALYGSDMIDDYEHDKFCADCGVKMKPRK